MLGRNSVARSFVLRRILLASVLGNCVRHMLAFSATRSALRRYSSLRSALQDTKPAVNAHYQESLFKVTSKYAPTGDQPAAIAQLTQQIADGDKFSILQGITGTGKTFVMSHVIAAANKPCLVLCHNKTLAAQLARELRSFFSENAVELFVSYYNHYVPESFVETTGKYTAKKSSVNTEIDALRHRATRALLTRSDCVVVASVSCIYGLGLPKEYLENSVELTVGNSLVWPGFQENLSSMQYVTVMEEDSFERGKYQLDDGEFNKTLVLWPPYERFPMKIVLTRDSNEDPEDTFRVDRILRGSQVGFNSIPQTHLFPAKHHVTSQEDLERACLSIEEEMRERTKELIADNNVVESERLQQRVVNDLMMMRETGFCSGIENYSRHFVEGRKAGEPPDTLMEYMGHSGKRDWLLMVDESHVTLPQLSAMYGGDQARKKRLVKYGYRLPSALDNRPLQGSEFWSKVQQTVFVSATPSKRELEQSEREPVQMVIRPTFVPDPSISVRPPEGQLEDLKREVQKRKLLGEKTLAISLTKRDAEDLSSYLNNCEVKSTYIHSGLTTHERSDALKALQTGRIDCLVGVNLLREGLDLPQVSLVAILSADSEGFLRSETALTQTVGRAARNTNGQAIFYAKRITDSMKNCIDDTERRRSIQLAYNDKHGRTMVSTTGSSTMSIFDLSKDQIDAELSLEHVGRGSPSKSASSYSRLSAKGTMKLQEEDSGSPTTDHVPNSPGVYFWKDADGNVLYIGKGAKLRSRVKSYLLPSAKHSSRITLMIKKAASVEFVLTPSERDALVLESNLIKYHQPPYNVLLKDDEHYPYICASYGDQFPRLFVSPRASEGSTMSQNYKYFGPYVSFKEVNEILEGIEEKYNLREKSFLARHGSSAQEEYQLLFENVMDDVFGSEAEPSSLSEKRSIYEEAGLLFDSTYNACRDVVAVGQLPDDRKLVVHIVQLRDGLVAGSFSYSCQFALSELSIGDFGDAIRKVLVERHYPAGMNAQSKFTWYPDSVLLSHSVFDSKMIRDAIKSGRESQQHKAIKSAVVKTAAKSGKKFEVDKRVLNFAWRNAQYAALEQSPGNINLLDGTASSDLSNLLQLDEVPSRIECYDISHLQGSHTVASRVVFVDGKPVPSLYRKFNIKTLDDGAIDDYAAIEEVLHRRFLRVPNADIEDNQMQDGWDLPDLVVIDGGKGQLASAIKGMQRAGVDTLDLSRSKVKMNNAGHPAVAVCSIAKKDEHVFIMGKTNPVNCSRDSPALLLLRSIRDESHRFALATHRRRRSILKSS